MKQFYYLKYGAFLACLMLTSIVLYAQNGVPTSLKIYPQNVNLLVEQPTEIKVLSINNSLIDYNDQHSVFNQLALATGRTAKWSKQTRLGQSLRWHYEEGDGNTTNGPSAKLRVRSQPWTHIVLQEQSEKPLTNLTDFIASVKLWQQYIKDYCPNPNAKIILAMNWAYTDASDFNSTTQQLYANYMTVAQELGITVCPIGNAYNAIRQTDGESAKNALYTDNRHPTVLATYLASCAQYATLFGASPVNINYYPSSISAGDAARMQNYAWAAYQGHDDVVDDINGIVRFSYSVLDQSNNIIPGNSNLVWNADKGGTIETGVFTRTGNTEEIVSVTGQTGELTANANINLIKAIVVQDELFAEISNTVNYTQDFNNIGANGNATLPLGWKIERRLDAPRTVGFYSTSSNTTEQTGGNSIASTAPNGIYNFGAGNIPVDRAVGGISTAVANGTRGINVYLKIRNTGESSIDRLDISYNVEKYRKGNNAAGFTMQLYYSSDGETWSSAGDAFKTSFVQDDATAGYAVAPGDSRFVNSTLNRNLAAGADLYLAWNYSVTSGTDAQGAQALGIDDISIQKSTTPPVIDYTSISVAEIYSQNFDNIGNAIATLPLGWKIEKRLDAPRTVGNYNTSSNKTEQTGGNSIASNAPNGIYNFGAGNNPIDRAVGGISTGIDNGTRGINIYLKIRNAGASSIDRLDISYNVEKYRKGNNAAGFTMQLYYSSDGETWTSAGDAFKTSFVQDDATAGYASAPGDSRSINSPLNRSLAVGADLYLAWNYSVTSGTDAQGAQALGIDDVSVKGINTALPLEWISFSAKLKSDGINKYTSLTWTTVNERNTLDFEVERSIDGDAFKTIGRVIAKQSLNANSYSYTDDNIVPGTLYYRLKQIDLDGTATYSEIRSIKNYKDLSLSYYPNPATNEITLIIPQELETGNISIYNLSGKKVLHKLNVINKENISLSDLESGTYILEIKKGGEVNSLKFIKQ
jgi:hypothetical protein